MTHDRVEMSHRPPTVIVCLGDGEFPDAAMLYAVETAAHQGALLRILHVDPRGERPRPSRSPRRDTAPLPDPDRERVEDARRKVLSLGLPGVRVETVTAAGSILARVLELGNGADLIVVQHRRLSHLHRLITGSLTARVAARGGRPVVSVPEFWSPWPGSARRVTVGVEAPLEQELLLEHAYRRADEAGDELQVLHVRTPPRSSRSTQPYDDQVRRRQDALAEWVDRVGERFPRVAVTTRTVSGGPSAALVEASRTAALVVVERSATARPGRLGAVTRSLLDAAHCPVEVLPPCSGDVRREPRAERDVLLRP